MHQQEERTSPWVIAFRIAFTFCLAFTILFIFHNSLEGGELSDARSLALMAKINEVLQRFGIRDGVSNHFVRKSAHFLEYCLEGFWFMLCLRVYTRHFVRHVSWPLLGVLLTAMVDETIQMFSAGRSSQLSDVWLDFAGAVTGLFLALLILLLFRLMGSVHRYERLVAQKSREAEQKARAQRRAVREETLEPEAETYSGRYQTPRTAPAEWQAAPPTRPARATRPAATLARPAAYPAAPAARQTAAQPTAYPARPAAQPPQIRIEFQEEDDQ